MNETVCSAKNCARPARFKKLCDPHRERLKRTRSTQEDVPIKIVSKGRKVCSVEGCEKQAEGWGYCGGHYTRLRTTGSVRASEPLRDYDTRQCKVADCGELKKGLGFCDKHYQQYKKHGRPEGSGRWRDAPELGSRVLDKSGYVLLYVKAPVGRGRYVREHRYVMEQFLKRSLTKDESVHHKNGNKQDNRLENLELWARLQPTGQRAKDLLHWAKEIIAKYGKEEELL